MTTNPKQQCLQELKHALQLRGDAWRIASLATVDAAQSPQVRSVVLREVDTDAAEILIYTDKRSQKVLELAQHPHCSLLLWCPVRQQQLRMACQARFLAFAASHWQSIFGTHAVHDYATQSPPGETLADAVTFDLAKAEQNFCVIAFAVVEIDRLWLSKEGHRRQRIRADEVKEICP